MNRNKKYQLNHNPFFYNPRTKTYQTKDGGNMTYAEAIQNKWKCEKCLETFPNYKTLFIHKKEDHS